MVYSTGATSAICRPCVHFTRENINHWWLDTSDSTGPDVSWLSTARHKLYQIGTGLQEVLNTDTGAIWLTSIRALS